MRARPSAGVTTEESRYRYGWPILPAVALLLGLATAAPAQITTDGSLGGARQSLTGSQVPIGEVLGQRSGRNLFHSFEEFNVQSGQRVTFTGAPDIANVVSRVTGPRESSILGTLRSDIAGANLFLLNPRGVLFGPNARLEVSGSFHASTAQYLAFPDGRFHVDPARQSVLSVMDPTAFGFLGPGAPAPITIDRSQLQVPAGRALSVVGGNIGITGTGLVARTLFAPGGRVQIVSVGEVSPGGDVQQGTGAGGSPPVLGPVRLTSAVVDASGTPAGTVFVRGGTLASTGSSLRALSNSAADAARVGIDLQITNDAGLSGTSLFARTAAGGRGGDIRIDAGNLRMDGASFIDTTAGRDGRGGDIAVTVGGLTLAGGATISVLSNAAGSTGSAGNLTVEARGAIDISGRAVSRSGLVSETRTGGAGGRVVVTGESLALDSGGTIATRTLGAGQGGDVAVTIRDALNLGGGATIASRAAAAGRGGALTITADTGSLSGSDASGPSGIVSGASGSGAAGPIGVDARRLTLAGGALIQSGSLLDPQAGEINVRASEAVTISDGAAISSQAFATDVTRISVSAPQIVIDRGLIQASTIQDGAGGHIVLDVGSLQLAGGAQIVTSSFASGRGGDVRIIATGPVSIAGRSSTAIPGNVLGADTASGVFSNAESTGDAGQVTLTAPAVSLGDGGRISVSTSGPGRGGAVVLGAQTLSLAGGARIDSGTGASGAAGNIEVAAATIGLFGGARIDSGTRGAGEGGTARVTATDAITISGRGPDGERSGIRSNAESTGAAGAVFVTSPVLTMIDASIAARTLGSAPAGTVVVDVGRLTLSGGAQIDSTTFGAGAGGRVEISAAESVTIAGINNGMISNAFGAGPAGQVTIVTPVLLMTDGASVAAVASGAGDAGAIVLQVGTLGLAGGSRVTSSTTGGGSGGTVAVRGGAVDLTGGSRLTSNSSGGGAGGDIAVSADRITLTDRAGISATSTGTGTAGSIAVTALTSLVSRDSTVRTDASTGDGGNIAVLGGGLLHLIDSGISATVQGGKGGGGNIAVGAAGPLLTDAIVRAVPGLGSGAGGALRPRFVVLDGSQIRADAFGGPGGSVQIDANVFLQTASVVSASSALGVQGTVDINAQIRDVSGTLARLPEAIRQAAALLRDSCAARVSARPSSTLVLGTRDAAPPVPGQTIPSGVAALGAPSVALAAPRAGALPGERRHLLVLLHCSKTAPAAIR